MKGSTYTVLFRNALSTSTSWLPWVKLLWHINDFSAVVISCRCRRSSSSPSKHHILSRSNVSSRKPFSYKLTLFEALALNEILQIVQICKKFPKLKASVLNITGNLLTFKITFVRKLRTSDRLKWVHSDVTWVQITNSAFFLVNLESLVLDQLIILNWYFTLFSSLLCLILYWYCKERFSLSHSWEVKG